MAEFVKVESKITITLERWELDVITEALLNREGLYNVQGPIPMPSIVCSTEHARALRDLRETLEEFCERT